MTFDPKIGETITIYNEKYKFLKNENIALETVDEREGGEGIVYRLAKHDKPSEIFALKRFFGNLSSDFAEDIYISTVTLTRYKDLPGLRVCNRKLIKDFVNCPESQTYSELKNSVLMPWIRGYTWHDVIVGYQQGKKLVSLDKSECFKLAYSTIKVLSNLESNRLAHCDIASGNIIFDVSKNMVELIDVEDMYCSDSRKPKQVPSGSAGYKHPNSIDGIWFPEGDRFAGAVLICEMLTWHNPAIKKMITDDTFFSNNELGQYIEKYELVYKELANSYSQGLADLFQSAWFSETIQSCPALSDWLSAFSQIIDFDKPVLSVSPLHLDFDTITHQKSLFVSISNAGKGILRGNISQSENTWLTIRQRAFELHIGEKSDLEVIAASPSNLSPGLLLFGNIIIDSNGGQYNVDVSGKIGTRPQVHNPHHLNPWTAIIGCAVIICIGLVLLLVLIGVLNNNQSTPAPTSTVIPTQPIVSVSNPIYSPTPKNIIILTTSPTKISTPTQIIHSATTEPLLPTLGTTPDFFNGNNCPGAPPIKIAINDLVTVVTTNSDRLILRSEPKLSDALEKVRLNYGTLLKIHDGPVCVHDQARGKSYWFWEVKVKSTNMMGWVAEGDTQMYYIKKVK